VTLAPDPFIAAGPIAAAADVTRRILSRAALVARLAQARRRGQRIAFTNGCFDLLHAGHIQSLERVKRLADVLVVGINNDASVRRLKGPGRPLVSQQDRARILAALRAVDYVTIFPEDTPAALIAAVRPDVLAKGADWSARDIVGADVVRRRGGQVLRIPFLAGRSTTRLIHRIEKRLAARASG